MGSGGSKKQKKQQLALSAAEEKYACSEEKEVQIFQKCGREDFEFLKTVGEGSFGRVRLARHQARPDHPLAIKVLRKRHCLDQKQVEHLRNERAVLMLMRSPFIVRLHSTFQDAAHVFMVLDFVAGGEMFTYLRDEETFSSARARLYAAEIFLALESMHRQNIIYRDLKPENLLITREGHVVITDFGFAKLLKAGRTFTVCGTPDYLAPEIVKPIGHGKGVDWWGFGVLIYEMCVGYPPFFHESIMEIYKRIVAGRIAKFPRKLAQGDKPLVQLVVRLLQVNVTKRLGCMKNGPSSISSHKWFKSLEWASVYERKYEPEFKPRADAPFDASNFDDDYEDVAIRGVESDLTEAEQEQFSVF